MADRWPPFHKAVLCSSGTAGTDREAQQARCSFDRFTLRAVVYILYIYGSIYTCAVSQKLTMNTRCDVGTRAHALAGYASAHAHGDPRGMRARTHGPHSPPGLYNTQIFLVYYV